MTIQNNDATPDLTTADGVAAYMAEAKSESDWNKRCDEVKRVNAGYPSFWYPTIIISGIAANTQANWR